MQSKWLIVVLYSSQKIITNFASEPPNEITAANHALIQSEIAMQFVCQISRQSVHVCKQHVTNSKFRLQF